MRLKPLLFVASLLQVALCLAVSLRTSPAEACEPLAPDRDNYYTLTESRPGDGASNVPLDARPAVHDAGLAVRRHHHARRHRAPRTFSPSP